MSETSLCSTEKKEPNEWFDCQDREGVWTPAEVVNDRGSKLLIHYHFWDPKWDEWIERDSARLDQYGAHKDEYRYPAGFQDSPSFLDSPYGHLPRSQVPMPRKRLPVPRIDTHYDAQLAKVLEMSKENQQLRMRGYKNILDALYRTKYPGNEDVVPIPTSKAETAAGGTSEQKNGFFDDLLSPWEQVLHFDSKRICYLNHDTFETQWQKPLIETDIEMRSNLWYLRFSIEVDADDIMKLFLDSQFAHDQTVVQKCLEWGAKFSSVSCFELLLSKYKPHISAQAIPLVYAVRNKNPDFCDALVNEMLNRRKEIGEQYTILHSCFKGVIKADYSELAEKLLREKLYRATESDYDLANKLGGDVWSLCLAKRYEAAQQAHFMDCDDDVSYTPEIDDESEIKEEVDELDVVRKHHSPKKRPDVAELKRAQLKQQQSEQELPSSKNQKKTDKKEYKQETQHDPDVAKYGFNTTSHREANRSGAATPLSRFPPEYSIWVQDQADVQQLLKQTGERADLEAKQMYEALEEPKDVSYSSAGSASFVGSSDFSEFSSSPSTSINTFAPNASSSSAHTSSFGSSNINPSGTQLLSPSNNGDSKPVLAKDPTASERQLEQTGKLDDECNNPQEQPSSYASGNECEDVDPVRGDDDDSDYFLDDEETDEVQICDCPICGQLFLNTEIVDHCAECPEAD